jgi:hypothetical protein
MWLYANSLRARARARVYVCVCGVPIWLRLCHGIHDSLDHIGIHTHTKTESTDIQPYTDTLYNNCKSTFQFSNLAKYGHGPPEDGFKWDRNMQGRTLSVLVWGFSVLKCSEVHELEQ